MTRSIIRAAACVALLSLIPAPVLGHSALVSATPGPGDELVDPPVELVAVFSQDLDPSRTSLEVRDVSGATIARGGEPGGGPREFRLALPQLAPGTYEIRWTSFSAEDGELARDSYTFTVLAAPSPSSPPSPPSPTPSSPPSRSPTPIPVTPAPSATAGPRGNDVTATGAGAVLLPIVAAALIAGGIGLWLLRRRAP